MSPLITIMSDWKLLASKSALVVDERRRPASFIGMNSIIRSPYSIIHSNLTPSRVENYTFFPSFPTALRTLKLPTSTTPLSSVVISKCLITEIWVSHFRISFV